VSIVIVQASTPTKSSGSLTATTAFSSNPTAGNAIVVAYAHWDTGASNNTTTFSDGHNTYDIDYRNGHVSNTLEVDFVSTFGIAGSGSPLTISAVYGGGTAANMRWGLAAWELSGLGGFDQGAQNFNVGSTTPTTGSTGTLANANSFVMAAFGANGSASGATVPPTGGPGSYTDAVNDLTGASGWIGDVARQLIASSTAAVSAAWGTMSGSPFWVSGLAVYKAASSSKLLLLST
jgi:hypothetical protein